MATGCEEPQAMILDSSTDTTTDSSTDSSSDSSSSSNSDSSDEEKKKKKRKKKNSKKKSKKRKKENKKVKRSNGKGERGMEYLGECFYFSALYLVHTIPQPNHHHSCHLFF